MSARVVVLSMLLLRLMIQVSSHLFRISTTGRMNLLRRWTALWLSNRCVVIYWAQTVWPCHGRITLSWKHLCCSVKPLKKSILMIVEEWHLTDWGCSSNVIVVYLCFSTFSRILGQTAPILTRSWSPQRVRMKVCGNMSISGMFKECHIKIWGCFVELFSKYLRSKLWHASIHFTSMW